MTDKKKIDEAAILNVTSTDGDMTGEATFVAEDAVALAQLLKRAGLESGQFNGPATLSIEVMDGGSSVTSRVSAPDLRSIMNLLQPEFQQAGDMEASDAQGVIDTDSAIGAITNPEDVMVDMDGPESIDPRTAADIIDTDMAIDDVDMGNDLEMDIEEPIAEQNINENAEDEFYDFTSEVDPSALEDGEIYEEDLEGTYASYMVLYIKVPAGVYEHGDQASDELGAKLEASAAREDDSAMTGWATLDDNADADMTVDNVFFMGWYTDEGNSDGEVDEAEIPQVTRGTNDYDDRYDMDDMYDKDLPKPGDTVEIDGNRGTVGAEADQDAYGGPAAFEVHYDDGSMKVHTIDTIWEGDSSHDEGLEEDAEYDYRTHDQSQQAYPGVSDRKPVQPKTHMTPSRSSDNPLGESTPKSFRDYVNEATTRNYVAPVVEKDITAEALLKELSVDTINRYVGRVGDSRPEGKALAMKKKWGNKDFGFEEPKVKARWGHEVDEETVNEISNDTKNSYFKKAAAQINQHAQLASDDRELGNDDNADAHQRVIRKRAQGMNRAIATEDEVPRKGPRYELKGYAVIDTLTGKVVDDEAHSGHEAHNNLYYWNSKKDVPVEEASRGGADDYARKAKQYGPSYYMNTDCGFTSLDEIAAGRAQYFDDMTSGSKTAGVTVLEIDRNGKKGFNYITGLDNTPDGTQVTCVTQTSTGSKYRPGRVVTKFTSEDLIHSYDMVVSQLAQYGITPSKKLSVKTFD